MPFFSVNAMRVSVTCVCALSLSGAEIIGGKSIGITQAPYQLWAGAMSSSPNIASTPVPPPTPSSGPASPGTTRPPTPTA